jgi:predicted acetyltransferase
MWEPRMLWGQTVEIRAKSVSVSEASTSQRRLIECLMQFYIYEFMWPEPSCSIHIECDDQNRYPPFADLNRYWRIEGFHPLLIRVEGRLAGFALINTHSRHGERIELNMAEFFVAREHRRRGVATEAVRLILVLYPGRWEIAVAEHNVAAKMFWSRTLAATPNVGRLVRLEGDGKRWRGPIWSFQSASSDVRCAEDELTEQPLRLSHAPSARQVSLF